MSISKPHNYEQIELPWGMSVQLFKYHIMSKLHKRCYTTNESLAVIYQNVLNDEPNPLLVEIFDERSRNRMAVWVRPVSSEEIKNPDR
jgi:hypothetical protein